MMKPVGTSWGRRLFLFNTQAFVCQYICDKVQSQYQFPSGASCGSAKRIADSALEKLIRRRLHKVEIKIEKENDNERLSGRS